MIINSDVKTTPSKSNTKLITKKNATPSKSDNTNNTRHPKSNITPSKSKTTSRSNSTDSKSTSNDNDNNKSKTNTNKKRKTPNDEETYNEQPNPQRRSGRVTKQTAIFTPTKKRRISVTPTRDCNSDSEATVSDIESDNNTEVEVVRTRDYSIHGFDILQKLPRSMYVCDRVIVVKKNMQFTSCLVVAHPNVYSGDLWSVFVCRKQRTRAKKKILLYLTCM